LNKTSGEKSLIATTPFYPGDVICTFGAGVTQSFATYLTVQTGVDRHITLQPEFLQYINHSCAPNVFFDTTTMELVCLQALQPGDELTFFYPSTEWDMAQPFICHCGSPDCLQLINGASHLTSEILDRYRLTNFIRQMISRSQVNGKVRRASRNRKPV
ncbi:MAG TPA: SET domain-containing protein-lysine N-methyltransferase, partial [Saprospiraceae bacterium]|nr:SET domain-containing protein-lysine N-methyltransferase [Saprospiraceae bacterium]